MLIIIGLIFAYFFISMKQAVKFIGVAMIVLRGRDRRSPIPFGPYLAGAGLIALFWGQQIIDLYLGYAGM